MKKLSALLLILTLLFGGCKILTPDQYYDNAENSGNMTATFTINCQTAVDYPGSKVDKPDILSDYSVNFNDGDTVYDALVKVCKLNKIQFEYTGSGDSVYIKGINYLYEFDCGELSGWEYCVNGKFPSVGCNAYKLSDGDEIKFLYTTDLGADIGNKYKGD